MSLSSFFGGILEQPNQGETIASITGSILQQFDFESSITNNSHSVEDDQNQSMDMSICKSENLFSPVTENQQQLPLSTFSTDSLDARGETILATCMTNRNNYTIAFQGLELDESVAGSTYRTATENNMLSPASDMTENEMTNWRQLKTTSDNGNINKYSQNPSDNNNGSSETSSTNFHQCPFLPHHRALLTQSCPNPWFWKRNSTVFNNNNHPKVQTAAFVKLFDIHMSRPLRDNSMTESNIVSGSGSQGSRMGDNNLSTGTGSTGSSNHRYIMEESWNNNRNPNPNPFRIRTKFEKARPTTTTQIAEAIKRSRSIQIQTSTIKLVPKKIEELTNAAKESIPKKKPPVFICFPNYTLPDLAFLQSSIQDEVGGISRPEVYLLPQQFRVPGRDRRTGQVQGRGGQEGQDYGSGGQNYQRGSHQVQRGCQDQRSCPRSNQGQRSCQDYSPSHDYSRSGQDYSRLGQEGQGYRRPGQGYRRGQRPMSCNDMEDLKQRDLSHVRDWPSLNFLLPHEYQSILQEMKPLEKREQSDETEKERDASVVPVEGSGGGGGGGGVEVEHNEPVILRKKPGRA
ncbi:unnamed protein product, partial [Allacma fusca]